MKKVTLLNGIENSIPEDLKVICIDGTECVCTDKTFAKLAELIESTDYKVEDMDSEEFSSLPFDTQVNVF